jgi:hypothetical protein
MAIPHRQETPVKELPTEESYTKGPSEGMSSKKGLSKEVEERSMCQLRKISTTKWTAFTTISSRPLREINKNSTEFQVKKNKPTNDIDTFPIASLQKNKMKTQSPRILNLAKTIILNTAQVLIMEHFEKEFRSKWTGKKESSVLQRDAILDKKKVESAKIRKSYMEAWKMSMTDLGMTVLEIETCDGTDAITEFIENTEAMEDDKATESEERARQEDATESVETEEQVGPGPAK